MADKNYTYAVARIRAMETALFSSSVIEQLMAVKTWSGCLDFLREKGWGSGNLNEGAEEMLEAEEAKAQKTVRISWEETTGFCQCSVIRSCTII